MKRFFTRTTPLILGVGVMITTAAPAFSIVAGPEAAVPSAILALGCLGFFDRDDCAMLALDPPASGISSIDFTIAFNASKLEIIPTPFYYGVFSSSGTQYPLKIATIGGIQPLELNPGIDLTTALQPRSGTSASFSVDNVNGTASLNFDLSANPTPDGSEPQNFFGYQIVSKLGPIAGIEYFNTPGNYDVTYTSFSCKTTRNGGCGSDHPVYGYNVKTVPEPSSILGALTCGVFGVGAVLKRKRKLSKLTAKKTAKVS